MPALRVPALRVSSDGLLQNPDITNHIVSINDGLTSSPLQLATFLATTPNFISGLWLSNPKFTPASDWEQSNTGLFSKAWRFGLMEIMRLCTS
jgi:hypothetical protein